MLPPRSPEIVVPQARPASVLYAVVVSFCAFSATASPKCVVPVTVPGGNPVTELAPFGEMPRSPVTTVGPVFVTADAPSTANGVAVPIGTVCADAAETMQASMASASAPGQCE